MARKFKGGSLLRLRRLHLGYMASALCIASGLSSFYSAHRLPGSATLAPSGVGLAHNAVVHNKAETYLAPAETTGTAAVDTAVPSLSNGSTNGNFVNQAPVVTETETTEVETTHVTDDAQVEVYSASPRVQRRFQLPPKEKPFYGRTVAANEWDPTEFERLTAAAGETTDALAGLPTGGAVTPAAPLTLEELLQANRPEEPVAYKLPNTPGGRIPFGALPPGQIEIESPDFLDYDEEHNMIYGHGRITVRYGPYKLAADRLMIDTRLREIQAYGNVVLASDTEYVEAESMWVNADNLQGVAYGARGRSSNFYFLGDPECADGKTTFRQLSQHEAHFKESSFTTCEFPVPHYRVHANEFTIMYGDRIFAKNVVIYIWECPVLWLPYFTMALRDDNPWGVTIGSDESLGFFLRVFYDYYHSCYTPADDDPNIMVRSTRGHARLRTDFFSKRGFGKGLYYSYYIDRGKHRGAFDAYHINDKDRDVVGEKNEGRYYVDWFHRTRITDELDWFADVDYMSDPEIFYDIHDRLRSSNDLERGRVPERRAQTGFEWTTDDFYAGLQVEIKDRIGRNRVSNFQDPRDGDQDYDRQFNTEEFFTLSEPGVGPDGRFYPKAGTYSNPLSYQVDDLDSGLSNRRYGRVTERLPHLRVSSNRERLWCLPLWYHCDLNVFNNLDKGLNVVSAEDDAFVSGFDYYQSISHLMKFCDRYTLLTKVGLGVGVAQRWEDSYNLDFPDDADFPFIQDGQLINGVPTGLTFVDEDTFLIGERRMSLADVDPFFAYGDIDSRFNARISDCVTAWARYRFREGTDNNLGEFYETMGSRKTKDDLYAFRTKEHWIEAGLTYNLLRPRLNLTASIGRNLQPENEIHAHELLQYANLGVGYVNLCNTFFLNSGIGLQERQQRDPTDPFQFQQQSLTYYVSSSYMPVHRRYWSRLSAFFIANQDDDPLGAIDDGRDFDTRTESIFDWSVGKRIGTKYLVEYRTRMRSRDAGFGDSFVRVERDFHDMVAGIGVGVKADRLDELEDEEAERENNFQIKLSFRLKPSSEKGVLPVTRSAELLSASKLGAFETGG